MASTFHDRYESGSINEAVYVFEEKGTLVVDDNTYPGREEIAGFFTAFYDSGAKTFESTVLSNDGCVVILLYSNINMLTVRGGGESVGKIFFEI
jgi:hypothetical protein